MNLIELFPAIALSMVCAGIVVDNDGTPLPFVTSTLEFAVASPVSVFAAEE